MFPEEETKKRRHPDSEMKEEVEGHKPVLLVTPYTIPNRGPYPYNQPKRSTTLSLFCFISLITTPSHTHIHSHADIQK